MDWKKAVARLIEQQKKKELDAQVGLVHGRKYEKPDGTKDVFVEGKRGQMIAPVRYGDKREAVIALDDAMMDEKRYKHQIRLNLHRQLEEQV